MAHRETARHVEAFEVYCNNDRHLPTVAKTCRISPRTAGYWCEWFDWRNRADRRDHEAAQRAEREAINRRAAFLKRQREAGELLMNRGVERLLKRPIDSEKTAVVAIGKGVEIGRQAEGLPDWVGQIMNADEGELERQRADLEYRRRAALDDDRAAPVGTALVEVGSNGHS